MWCSRGGGKRKLRRRTTAASGVWRAEPNLASLAWGIHQQSITTMCCLMHAIYYLQALPLRADPLQCRFGIRRRRLLGCCLGVCEQHGAHRLVGSKVERRSATKVANRCVGLCFQQHAHTIGVSILDCAMQSRAASKVSGIELGVLSQQRLDDSGVAMLRRLPGLLSHSRHQQPPTDIEGATTASTTHTNLVQRCIEAQVVTIRVILTRQVRSYAILSAITTRTQHLPRIVRQNSIYGLANIGHHRPTTHARTSTSKQANKQTSKQARESGAKFAENQRAGNGGP